MFFQRVPGYRCISDLAAWSSVQTCVDTFLRDLAIKGISLTGLPTDACDQVSHPGGGQFLPMRCARGPRDTLIHQRATKIVAAALKAGDRSVNSHLDPGRLNIRDLGM